MPNAQDAAPSTDNGYSQCTSSGPWVRAERAPKLYISQRLSLRVALDVHLSKKPRPLGLADALLSVLCVPPPPPERGTCCSTTCTCLILECTSHEHIITG